MAIKHGVLNRHRRHIESKYPIGGRYGRLVITGYAERGHTLSPICLCDCGGTKTVEKAFSLGRRHVTSCGCLSRETRILNGKNSKGFTLGPGEGALNQLYSNYRGNANRKVMEFALTREQFKQITSHPCNYCGEPPSAIFKSKFRPGNYVYNGVDRVDNSRGYTIDNVVSCCRMCQFAKRNWKVEDFLRWALKLADYQRSQFHAGVRSTEPLSVSANRA